MSLTEWVAVVAGAVVGYTLVTRLLSGTRPDGNNRPKDPREQGNGGSGG